MAKITAKEYQQIREVKIIDVLSKEPMLGDFYKMESWKEKLEAIDDAGWQTGYDLAKPKPEEL
jgi:hypothetical protein